MAKKQKDPSEMSAEELIAYQNSKMAQAPTDDEVSQIARAEEHGGEMTEAPEAPVPDPPAPMRSVEGAPDPWAVMNRMAAAIEALAARPSGEGGDSKAIQVLTEAMVRMTESTQAGSAALVEENRKAFRPSNQVPMEVSVFNRRGRDPKPIADATLDRMTRKPKLKCDMFTPGIAEWESLTREEVQLLNLLEAGAYVISRADRSKITVTIKIVYDEGNKKPSKLFVLHETAFNQENFRNMPPMVDWLRGVLKQHDRPIAAQAASVITDEEEEALIEAGKLSVTS